jgi:hypothetical protein
VKSHPLILSMCFAALVFANGSAFATGIGLIPGAPARLGAGFNILQPQTVYPACIAANLECQAGIEGLYSLRFAQGSADTRAS